MHTENKSRNGAPDGVIVNRRLLKTREAATYLGSSAWKIRQLVADGKLRYVADTEGGRWWFDVRDLDRFTDANKRSY